MKTRAELKAMAKEQIRGNIGALFVITLIIGGISFLAGLILGMIPMGSLIVSLIITPAFSLSTLRIYLALVNSGQKPEPRDAFSGFDDFWSAFKTTFLTGLFTFLWSLLFIIPGIIKGYSYSMAMYIVAENPGISALEAIDRSKKMMDGHKMEFFILYLSLYGWALLTVITFGIAGIWTIPYMNATLANFYNEVKPKETFYTNDAPAFDQF
jgi:uncharacterized membrane protein